MLVGVIRNGAGSSFLASGAVALAFAACRGRALGRAWLLSAFVLAFTILAFLLTPQDLVWHIDSAMSRLLLHAAGFALLAAASASREANA